jgi:class 3 adenylate cyclase/pimeloyl-ACP methyl ester carboxylesterase
LERRLAAILAADVVGYSRLMEDDETGTVERIKQVRNEIYDPVTAQHNGHIFKTTGDGILIEFPSAIGAVASAIAIQDALENLPEQRPDERAIQMRIGISLGDIIADDDDLFGNGVNIAARMESLAEPGSVFISGNVREQIRHDKNFSFKDFGPCIVKNYSEPVHVFQVFRSDNPTAVQTTATSPEIRFCRSPDGVQIAYAMMGPGPPVVLVNNWLTHLEMDTVLPSRVKMTEVISKDHLFVRFDARGNGLSDWDVEDFSFDAAISDLETVLNAAGLEQVSLLGQSQGAAIAAAFAARNPERVKKLAFYGGYARGRRKRGSDNDIAASDAFITLIRQGWGNELDAYIRMLGAFFMPDATPQQLAGFTNLQRKATTPENAASIQLALDSIDITDEVSKVVAPTLVLHAREDARVPFEEGRRLAASIPGARFIPLESRNHSLQVNEPAFSRYLDEVSRFFME